MNATATLKSVGAITLFVEDPNVSKAFYENAFDARPWGMRTAAFNDPDGHIWEIAQELSAAEA